MLWKVVMSRMCDALSTCQTEDYLLTQQLQWYSYEGNVRSIHIWATLQFTLGPKLKPTSFLQVPQTWGKLMAMFGLDSSPVSFSIALAFSSPSWRPTSCSLPSTCFWLVMAPSVFQDDLPFLDSWAPLGASLCCPPQLQCDSSSWNSHDNSHWMNTSSLYCP